MCTRSGDSDGTAPLTGMGMRRRRPRPRRVVQAERAPYASDASGICGMPGASGTCGASLPPDASQPPDLSHSLGMSGLSRSTTLSGTSHSADTLDAAQLSLMGDTGAAKGAHTATAQPVPPEPTPNMPVDTEVACGEAGAADAESIAHVCAEATPLALPPKAAPTAAMTVMVVPTEPQQGNLWPAVCSWPAPTLLPQPLSVCGASGVRGAVDGWAAVHALCVTAPPESWGIGVAGAASLGGLSVGASGAAPVPAWERALPTASALRNYKRQWRPRQEAWGARPLHDWTSHAADALRYAAIALGHQPVVGVTQARARMDYNLFGSEGAV